MFGRDHYLLVRKGEYRFSGEPASSSTGVVSTVFGLQQQPLTSYDSSHGVLPRIGLSRLGLKTRTAKYVGAWSAVQDIGSVSVLVDFDLN